MGANEDDHSGLSVAGSATLFLGSGTGVDSGAAYIYFGISGVDCSTCSVT